MVSERLGSGARRIAENPGRFTLDSNAMGLPVPPSVIHNDMPGRI